jgi:alkylhydroperoxidase/carboxymuconolactone decarboxylase family protein YurZ
VGAPDLSKRDRSLITLAMLAALYRTDENAGRVVIEAFGPK